MTPPKKSTSSIESKLNDLEKILEELESGNLELDESLKKFEKGIKEGRAYAYRARAGTVKYIKSIDF